MLLTAVGLTLAACGTSDSTATTATDPEPVPAETPASTDEADTTTGPVDTQPPATEPPATEPPVTEPPVAEPPPADPPPAPVGGRALATAIEPDSQFAGNPFPDLVVDDIGRNGEANIANILPSDRPVLLWTWAPH